jgi:predicted secreted protein
MAIERGKDWLVYLNTATYASPSWTLIENQTALDFTNDQDSIETTNKSTSGYKTAIISLKDLSCSFTILYDQASTNSTNVLLTQAAVNQTLKHFKLLGSGGQNWIFQAYVKMSYTANHDGLCEASVELVRYDAPVYAAS